MAKQASKNVAGFALQFISSLFFLAVVAALYGNVGASAGVWTPLLYAVAVVASVVLFLTSFAQLSGMAAMASYKAMSASVFASVSLVALTMGNSTLFVASLIGLILGLVGAASAMGGKA